MTAFVDVVRPAGRLAGVFFNVGVVVAGATLLALASQISIPLGFTPVPMTLQTLVVLLMGAFLGMRRGGAAVGVYLFEGACGLPVFAGGHGGFIHLFGPSGGYLFGFLLATLLIGFFLERGYRNMKHTLVIMTVGTVLIYLCGVAGLACYIGGAAAWNLGVIPFLLGDCVKMLIAASLVPAGWQALRRFNGS